MAYMIKESSCIGYVEDRSPSRIDRFFELVEERIAAAQAATSGDYALIETSSVQWGGRQ